MTSDELKTIRVAIHDPDGAKHSPDEIETVFSLLHENVYRTIQHFLLADAIGLADPTPPAMPELPAFPNWLSNLEVNGWQDHVNALLNKFSQELSLYRSQVDINRAKMEALRAQAELYQRMEGGY